jgi:5-methylthioribose kinase
VSANGAVAFACEHLLARGLVAAGTELEAELLPGGVSADVVAVTGPGLDVVVKRALPQFKTAVEWIVDVDRAVTEGHALQLVGTLTPALVPKVLDVDADQATLVLERAPVGWRDWKSMLLGSEIDPAVGRKLGEALAVWHAETARRLDDLDEFADAALFVQQRIDPFHHYFLRSHPDLAPQVDAVVTGLLTRRTCLVHGDFSPKNVLVGEGGLWVLDWEIAHLGNPVFDLAFVTAHLALKSVHRSEDAARYGEVVRELLGAYRVGDRVPESPPAELVANVGCLLLARVDGKSKEPAAYLTEPQREQVRALGVGLLREPVQDALDVWERIPAQPTRVASR